MHRADQFEAFQALIDEGKSIEDVATDFGITPKVVQPRLKLANVSPRLLSDYRADAVTLDQLMALALTDDHTTQEAVFYEVPEWQRSTQGLREHLMAREIDSQRDPLAGFVGIDAYEAAGGVVRRDLFSDDAQQAYLADAELLNQLARDKLSTEAENVRAEGQSWVDVVARTTHTDLTGFQRARRDRREPNAKGAKRIAKLEARQKAIEDKMESDEAADLAEEEAQALYEESDRLAAELDAIEQTLMVFPREVLAMAGSVVTVDHAGAVAVHRGPLRQAEAKALRESVRNGTQVDGADAPRTKAKGKPMVSGKLACALSAHRTAALQAELARQPAVALVAVVHRLALRIFYSDRYADAPLHIACMPRDRLDKDEPDLPGSPAVTALTDEKQSWQARLPTEAEELFAALREFSQADLLSLMAIGAAGCTDAVSPSESETKANIRADAEVINPYCARGVLCGLAVS